jgi:hypothetical protein
MFDSWSEGPRDWKWIVPGVLGIMLCLVVYQCWMIGTDGFLLVALALACVACIFFLSALTNYIWLVKRRSEELYREHMEALNATPLTKLADAMKQMHPEAVRVLDKFGIRTMWGVDVGKTLGERDWVLLGTDVPVRFGFIEYVLNKSGKALYPAYRFAEGSKKWDPDGVTLDRDQHKAFEKWMFARTMVTRSHGDYKPAEFIPPFTPKTIMELMGFTGEQELYRPDDEREVKQLPTESVKRESVGHPAGGSNVAKAERPEPDLTEEELAASRAEMEFYASKFVDGKVPS